MAIFSDLALYEAPMFSSRNESRKNLQRLIRKVQHVLIVKRCIDDLRTSTSLRRPREGHRRYVQHDHTPCSLFYFNSYSHFDPLCLHVLNNCVFKTMAELELPLHLIGIY
jgi:hypothetical protein